MPTFPPPRSTRTLPGNACDSCMRGIIRAPEAFSSRRSQTHILNAMAKEKHVSETPATRLLKKLGVAFTEHPYDYVERGGARESARQLGVDLHQVAKTLIMED